MFDPDKFMESVTSEAGSTKVEPIPSGEYLAIIDDTKVSQPGNAQSPLLEVHYLLQDEELKKKLGRQQLKVRQSIWLDTTENGGMDMAKGKNVKLGRLREALGMNQAGKPFKLSMLKGAGPLKVQVTLRPNKDAPDVIYNDVGNVGKA